MPNLMRRWQARYESIPRGSSESRADVVETGAAQFSAVEESARLRDASRWEELINSTLIELGRKPQLFADAEEGIAAPTPRAIDAAVKFALFAREAMLAAPGQVLPDGEGGLVIQHALPEGATESFEADADGNSSIWFYPRAPQKPVQSDASLPMPRDSD
jgi:hypothetical protein